MNEIRRFMRYVLPGIVFFTELLIYFALSHGRGTGALFHLATSANTVGTIVTVLFGSGAIGFLFANFYHSIISTCDWFTIDHRPLFRVNPPGFRALDIDGNTIPIAQLKRLDALNIITRFTHIQSALSHGKDIKGMRDITDRLVDIRHSIGTTIVATFLSPLSWVLIRLFVLNESIFCFSSISILLITIIWFFLLASLCTGYRHVGKSLERITNSSLFERSKCFENLIDIVYIR